MKTIGKTLCFLSALLALAVAVPAVTTVSAAELSLEGSRLRVSGVLDGTSVAAFNEQLATGKVQRVVFEDATGGTAEAAQAYAAAIRSSGVRTEVRGQCHAACAFAFLAAKEHRFGSGGQINGLLIPVTKRPKPEELATRWRGNDSDKALAASSDTQMANVMEVSTPTQSLESSTRDWQPEHGVLFVSNPTLFGRVYNAFYCDGTQGRDFSRCERLANADPYALGVLTH
ncbi:hypothetical protein ACSFA3_08985 [Variovorax sp. RHLX14]|uniref:hypothetical protein n=1 Tax=Variovorax sp. RHLX14 TaxID=1259731 RepID=UPI003F450D3D